MILLSIFAFDSYLLITQRKLYFLNETLFQIVFDTYYTIFRYTEYLTHQFSFLRKFDNLFLYAVVKVLLARTHLACSQPLVADNVGSLPLYTANCQQHFLKNFKNFALF